MFGAEDHRVAAVECECNALTAASALNGHLDGPKCRAVHLDCQLLDRRDEDVAAIRLAAQDRRKEPYHRPSSNRASLMVPGAVAGDPHARMTTLLRMPAVDRRQAPVVDELLEIGEAQALKFNRRAALW